MACAPQWRRRAPTLRVNMQVPRIPDVRQGPPRDSGETGTGGLQPDRGGGGSSNSSTINHRYSQGSDEVNTRPHVDVNDDLDQISGEDGDTAKNKPSIGRTSRLD